MEMCTWKFRERFGDQVEMADLQRGFEERAREKTERNEIRKANNTSRGEHGQLRHH